MKRKFLRLGYTQYSKLGLRRKKLQKYRRANGIDNKVRLKMKGHLRNVSIGFRSEKRKRGFVKGLRPVLVYNLDEMKKIGKEIVIIGKIGDKKKYELMEYALKHNIKVMNVNPKKFIEETKERLEKRKAEKIAKNTKKKNKEKKAKEEKPEEIKEKTHETNKSQEEKK